MCILGIAHPNYPTASQSYQYDLLDRLTVAQSGNPVAHTQQFSYDEVGNRRSATIDGGPPANLNYGTASNQASIDVRSGESELLQRRDLARLHL